MPVGHFFLPSYDFCTPDEVYRRAKRYKLARWRGSSEAAARGKERVIRRVFRTVFQKVTPPRAARCRLR